MLLHLLLDTEYLLETLAKKGHKVARDEIKLYFLCVQYLCHDISATGKTHSTDQASTIQKFPPLETKRQLIDCGGVGLWDSVECRYPISP